MHNILLHTPSFSLPSPPHTHTKPARNCSHFIADLALSALSQTHNVTCRASASLLASHCITEAITMVRKIVPKNELHQV